MTKAVIELKNISKIYHKEKLPLVVLKDLSLTLYQGEMKAIMGASGSGKSTLMNIIGLLDTISAGEYLLLQQNVGQLSKEKRAKIRNEKIGFIFQAFYLLPRLNALQNVMLPLYYQQIKSKDAKKIAFAMLEKMKLTAFYHHLPHQLSGGQQQRVAIARALVATPSIILADEPTGALDDETSKDIMNILAELNKKEGKTILIITHDVKISAYCQTVGMMMDGKIASV